jgi:Ca-activated chloride channel family protein
MGERPWGLWALGVVLICGLAYGGVKYVGKNSGSSAVLGVQGTATAAAPSAPKGSVAIAIASSNTKEDWLRNAVEVFNAAAQSNSKYQVDGKPVFVEVLKEKIDGKDKDYRSGTMVSDTVKGKIKPTVISPGEESWIDKFNKEWKIEHNSVAIHGESPVLVRTPLVVAMWQSRAKALGCWPTPGATCTLEKIRQLAASREGWKSVGRPEWGMPKIGYGYYGESNSGTLATTVICAVGARKYKGLKAEDVTPSSGCGKFIAGIEAAKTHSGKSDLWLLDQMVSGGPEYMDAVFTYESNVVLYNMKRGGEMREPLVSVYPQDGTVVVGHPFAILDGAPWVTKEQVEGAKLFQAFLLSREQQEKVLELGLRPVDTGVKIGAPLDAANGANTAAKLVTVEIPGPDIGERIGEVWHQVKKHSVIFLAFDKSGSMADGNKINAAVKGAQSFIKQMDGADHLVWLPFDQNVYAVTTQGTVAKVGEDLVGRVSSTTASGGTALNDAVWYAYTTLQDWQKKHGNAYRYGIVILSDGEDTQSRKSLSDIQSLLKGGEGDAAGIQVHAIGIGDDVNDKVLKSITSAGHGLYRKGHNQKDMEKFYKEIAAYF